MKIRHQIKAIVFITIATLLWGCGDNSPQQEQDRVEAATATTPSNSILPYRVKMRICGTAVKFLPRENQPYSTKQSTRELQKALNAAPFGTEAKLREQIVEGGCEEFTGTYWLDSSRVQQQEIELIAVNPHEWEHSGKRKPRVGWTRYFVAANSKGCFPSYDNPQPQENFYVQDDIGIHLNLLRLKDEPLQGRDQITLTPENGFKVTLLSITPRDIQKQPASVAEMTAPCPTLNNIQEVLQ